MRNVMKLFAGAAGLAALGSATPAAAQYYYGYSPYAYGYRANASNMAVQRCSAAVQARLNQPRGLVGILGAALGARAYGGRVLSVTQIDPNRRSVRVRGLASSGANYGYGPYGYGAYGAVGYAYRPDLRFKCDVDYRGYIRDVDIVRR